MDNIDNIIEGIVEGGRYDHGDLSLNTMDEGDAKFVLELMDDIETLSTEARRKLKKYKQEASDNEVKSVLKKVEAFRKASRSVKEAVISLGGVSENYLDEKFKPFAEAVKDAVKKISEGEDLTPDDRLYVQEAVKAANPQNQESKSQLEVLSRKIGEGESLTKEESKLLKTAVKGVKTEQEQKVSENIDDIMAKIAQGEELSDEEKQELSAAIDAAKKGENGDDDALNRIMGKIATGEELSGEEEEILSTAIEASKEEQSEDPAVADDGGEPSPEDAEPPEAVTITIKGVEDKEELMNQLSDLVSSFGGVLQQEAIKDKTGIIPAGQTADETDEADEAEDDISGYLDQDKKNRKENREPTRFMVSEGMKVLAKKRKV